MSLFNFMKKNKRNEEVEQLQPRVKDAIPRRIEDFREEHYKVLRRLKNHPVNVPFSGLMSLEVDIPNFIPVLMDLGLVRIGSYEEALNSLKSETLKDILSGFDMKTTGGKAVLVDRIITGIAEEDVRVLKQYSDIYVHTEITKDVIDASYEKFEKVRPNQESRQTECLISNERHRQEYIKHGTKKYRFLANLDDKTCPVCGALDGKTFNVDDMQPGVNCPPMHDGCRCTTIAAWEGLEFHGKRSARDPVTHKSILVPTDMTYTEYEKEYLKK